MADITPVEKGSKEATFTALAKDFSFDDKVRALFINGQMENLEDFRYYFAEEREIDAFVAAEDTLKGAEQKLQVSRVRRAWAAVRQNGLRKEKRNTVSSVAEMDDMLEEGTLREVKVQFWKRYKMKYPVEVIPSDQLLSRCYREMEKRLLTVYDMWKVKNLMHQVMTTKKRKQVGTDLYTFEDDADAATEIRGVEKYLSMLHTYLLALAIAGSNKMQGAPPEETFGSDSTKYVKVPWDVLQAYYFRASRSAMLIPEATRLTWLEAASERLLMVLFSMYFDDATMRDWQSEAFHSRACVAEFMQLLGSPWAEAKSQVCSSEGDFLGLMHDVSRAEEGVIRFWPRESLVTKVLSLIEIAREVGLTAGTASKLYGVANFIETGMYARVGRAGLWAIKDRQK